MDAYEKRVRLVDDYLGKMDLGSEILKHYQDRSILVTGGAGAIGSNLIIVIIKHPIRIDSRIILRVGNSNFHLILPLFNVITPAHRSRWAEW